MRITMDSCALASRWTLGLIFLAAPTLALAQQGSDIDSQKQAYTIESTDTAPNPSFEPKQSGGESMKTRAERTNRSRSESSATSSELEDMQQRIRELEARDVQKEEKIAELEDLVLERSMEDGEIGSNRAFTLSGFFDLGLMKWFYRDRSPAVLYVPDKSFFTISHFNLYMKSELTDSLSVLGELRFSFLPQGRDESYELAGLPAEGMPSMGIYGNEYTRFDTTSTDPSMTYQFKQGGLTIERVHLTYSPVSWFNIIAGRYLTPFGIWNVDHGSPVILTADVPYFIIREMVPLAQTGLQVYGRLFPLDRLFFDYALTLSNGRGPVESYMDLDENKAIGLRIKLSYEGNDFSISGGGYGYVGKGTFNKKVIHVIGLSPETSSDNPLLVDIEGTDVFNDYVLTGDISVEVYGVRLQAEYAFKYDDALVNLPMESDYAIFQGASAIDQLFTPSGVSHDFYILLGYRLPFRKWLDPVAITPYVMYEYGKVTDVFLWLNAYHYIGGVNVKPSPYVTIKLEGIHADHNKIVGDMDSVRVQMAVSF